MVLLTTDLPLPAYVRGKVRDVYDLDDRLLLIATDRISAFDVVLPSGIPDKGRVLTQLSAFWFQRLAALCPHHMIGCDASTVGAAAPSAAPYAGQAMVARKAEAIPVECVVRGYLSGSAWSEYRRTPVRDGKVRLWGLTLPTGLVESDRLESPVFTPTTKAHQGHDESITFDDVVKQLGGEKAERLRAKSLDLYRAAQKHAESRGLILADTKLEFGQRHGELIWIDEAFTPDSSRYWDRAIYAPGHSQPSFDKQFVRDYLEGLVAKGEWNKEPPGPELPPDVVEGTANRYREAYERLVGQPLS